MYSLVESREAVNNWLERYGVRFGIYKNGKFKEQLENSLWYSHYEFAANPLLLTIMLMTFANYADVPAQMHIFYREAYETLAQRHDASKGAYKREFRTKLTSSRFSDYLSEFCGRTYVEEKYKFTENGSRLN